MNQNIKGEILQELDSRLERLREHQDDPIVPGNQYEELNQALSKVIGTPLIDDLESLQSFVRKL